MKAKSKAQDPNPVIMVDGITYNTDKLSDAAYRFIFYAGVRVVTANKDSGKDPYAYAKELEAAIVKPFRRNITKM